MRLNKIFLMISVLFIFAVGCQAQEKVDSYDIDKDGNADHWTYWNADGTISRFVSKYKDNTVEKKYGPAEIVTINGEVLKKQMGIPDESDKELEQTNYVYTKPFQRIFVENYLKGKLEGRGYYKNNRIFKSEEDGDGDGNIDEWHYYDDNFNYTKVERDTDSDGKVDEWWSFSADKKRKIEKDTNGDGKPDTVLDAPTVVKIKGF